MSAAIRAAPRAANHASPPAAATASETDSETERAPDALADPLTQFQLHMERAAHAYANLLDQAPRQPDANRDTLADLLRKADELVDALPGAGKSRAEQEEEIRRLVADDAKADAALADAVKLAELALSRVKRLREDIARGVGLGVDDVAWRS